MMGASVAFRILALHAEAVSRADLPTGAILRIARHARRCERRPHFRRARAFALDHQTALSKQKCAFNLPSSTVLRMPQCNLAQN
jgi:hypothetical protein